MRSKRIIVISLVLWPLIQTFLFWANAEIIGSFSAGTETAVKMEVPYPREIITVGILGDRAGGASEDISILRDAVDRMNLLKPDFTIMVGDMVQGYNWDEGKWMGEAKEFKEALSGLESPFYPVCGNHDVLGGTRSPIPVYEKQYQETFAPLYYSFNYKASHFVVLYTEDGGTAKLSDRQIEWLLDDLKNGSFRDVFVFLHRPVWVEDPPAWGPVHNILKQYPVRAVISGHVHNLLKFKPLDGIEYFTIGASAGYLHKSKEGGGFHQIAQLRVGEDGAYRLAVIPIGEVIPADFMPAEDFYEGIDKIDGKDNRDTKIVGIVADPSKEDVDESLQVVVGNPTNKDCCVTVTVDPNGGTWQSNPKEFTVKSEKSLMTEIRIRCPKTDPKDMKVPDLLVTYNYPGSQGRMIPETLRIRVPVERSASLSRLSVPPVLDGLPEETWRAAGKIYTTHWFISSYIPRNEEDIRVFLGVFGEDLYFAAKIYDPDRSFFGDPPGKNILGDNVRLAGTDAEGLTHTYLFFPFDRTKKLYEAGASYGEWKEVDAKILGFDFAIAEAGSTYAVEGKISLQSLFGEGKLDSGEGRKFNIWLSDDDSHGHPLDRTWAPTNYPDQWGTVIFQ